MTMEDPVVANVERILKDPFGGDPRQAYRVLCESFAEATQGMSFDQANDRWNQITLNLQKRGLLPDVAVGFAVEQFGRINTGGDHLIDRSELRNVGGPNEVFAQELLKGQGKKDMFTTIARMYDADKADHDHISMADLDKYAHKQNKRSSNVRAENNAREAMRPLFEGEEPLISVLDKNSNGRITRHELNRFLDSYRANQGNGPYTEQNANYVKQIIEGNNSEFEHAFLGMAGFNVDKLARKGGFDPVVIDSKDDYELLKQNFELADMQHGGRPLVGEPPVPSDEVPVGIPVNGPPGTSEGEDETSALDGGAKPDEHDGKGAPEEESEGGDPGEEARESERAEPVICDGMQIQDQAFIQDLLTVRRAEGYWHVADRLIESGLMGPVPEHKDNNRIYRVMTALMQQNKAQFVETHPGTRVDYSPVLQPGDVVFFDPSKIR